MAILTIIKIAIRVKKLIKASKGIFLPLIKEVKLMFTKINQLLVICVRIEYCQTRKTRSWPEQISGFLYINYRFVLVLGIFDSAISTAFVSFLYMANKYVTVVYYPLVPFCNFLFVV